MESRDIWGGGGVVPNFSRLIVPKILFKDIKIKGESEFYK